MRATALSLSAAAALSVFLGGCFSPELGPNPYLCASDEPKCPEGYSAATRNGACVCVKEGTSTSDAALPKVERRILTDAELMPSKEGSVYLDGAIVKSSASCLDKDVEPNNSGATATPITGQGFIPGWEICYPGDVDQYAINLKQGQKLVVTVKFFHSRGDLDAALVDPGGFVVDASRGTKDNEMVRILSADKDGRYVLGVYGFGPAVNTYDLDIVIN